MTVARDIASARASFEKAEREINPGLKAHALDEGLALLAACNPDAVTESERELIANIRLSHTRRLLSQIMTLPAVTIDAWFDYVDLLFGELRTEANLVIAGDNQLRENYERFVSSFGQDVAKLLELNHGTP